MILKKKKERKQRFLQAHSIAFCIPHLQQGLPYRLHLGHCPQQGVLAYSVCLHLEISGLRADSLSHVVNIISTSPVLQFRAKMLLCNHNLVLLSKMFHQISCEWKWL